MILYLMRLENAITKTTGKMILTFNSELYSKLLSQFQPRIIKTEAENEQFLAVVEELLSRASSLFKHRWP
jgi:HTH-type transcriptional regulator/antitoxin HigA